MVGSSLVGNYFYPSSSSMISSSTLKSSWKSIFAKETRILPPFSSECGEFIEYFTGYQVGVGIVSSSAKWVVGSLGIPI